MKLPKLTRRKKILLGVGLGGIGLFLWWKLRGGAPLSMPTLTYTGPQVTTNTSVSNADILAGKALPPGVPAAAKLIGFYYTSAANLQANAPGGVFYSDGARYYDYNPPKRKTTRLTLAAGDKYVNSANFKRA